MHVHPLSLGSLTLPSNIMYAPLAGCTDYPMRKINALFNPALQFAEMVKMDAFIRNDLNTFRLLDFDHSMHPIGAQLVGSNQAIAGECAHRLESLGFDLIDLNCGCPVDKVTKGRCGSALLQYPEEIGELIYLMKKRTTIPISVKIRAGWDSNSINASAITTIAEQAGACMITIHGRTRAQGYKGFSDWSVIKEAKKAAKNIHVIGNGDIFSPELALEMFEYTGCDGILISRGMLGKPWIAEDCEQFLQTGSYTPRSGAFLKRILTMHIEAVKKYSPRKKAITDMRRLSAWYLKHSHRVKGAREQMARLASLDDIYPILETIPFDELDRVPYPSLERDPYT